MNRGSASLRSTSSAIEAGPQSVDAAIDLLVSRALAADPHDSEGSSVQNAAALVRNSVHGLESMQGELTVALIASQDRILAMKALAQINVHGVASDQTIGLLLENALTLTASSLVVLFDSDTVIATAGDTADLDERVADALTAIAVSPHDVQRTTAADSAVICTLDSDGRTKRYVAFFRRADRTFSTVDIPLIDAVVSSLGVMLAFTELHRRELEQAAVEREHQLASALAQSVITDRPPHSAMIDIFAKTVPASLTGGDFYVFGQTEGSIWFAVGDVAGKGLPAAMLMTRAVAACRVAFLAHRDASVSEVFARIEDELFDYLDEVGLFITMAVGVIHEDSGRVELVNAGHSPVVLVNDSSTELVPASVPPLGVIRHRVPRVATFVLSGDDTLLLGSDGLAEQSDPDGEMYGYERFSALCRENRALRSTPLGTTVFDTVNAFAAGSPASDDSTLVILKRGDGVS